MPGVQRIAEAKQELALEQHANAEQNYTTKEVELRTLETVSYTHLRAHETKANLVCRLLLEKKT